MESSVDFSYLYLKFVCMLGEPFNTVINIVYAHGDRDKYSTWLWYEKDSFTEKNQSTTVNYSRGTLKL